MIDATLFLGNFKAEMDCALHLIKGMSLSIDSIEEEFESEGQPVKGSNFLVSAIMILRKQRKDLEDELKKMRERVSILEAQNAGLLNVGADRLLEKRG